MGDTKKYLPYFLTFLSDNSGLKYILLVGGFF